MHTNTATHLGPLGPCKCLHRAQTVAGLRHDEDDETELPGGFTLTREGRNEIVLRDEDGEEIERFPNLKKAKRRIRILAVAFPPLRPVSAALRQIDHVGGLAEDKDRAFIFDQRMQGIYFIAATVGIIGAGAWELIKTQRAERQKKQRRK